MDNHLKTPVAGPHFSPLPILEYDYESAVRLAFDDSEAAATDPLPAGVYRFSADASAYIAIGEDAEADPDTAGTDYFDGPFSFWHEYVPEDAVVSVIAGSGGAGVLRLVPVKVIA